MAITFHWSMIISPSFVNKFDVLYANIDSIDQRGIVMISFSKSIVIPDNYLQINKSFIDIKLIPAEG